MSALASPLRGPRFGEVKRSGARARAQGVRVWTAANDLSVFRLGLAVTGSRTAVARNRARRRLRHAAAELKPEMTGIDMVVGAHVDSNKIPYAALASDLQTAARRAKAKA